MSNNFRKEWNISVREGCLFLKNKWMSILPMQSKVFIVEKDRLSSIGGYQMIRRQAKRRKDLSFCNLELIDGV